MNETTMSLDINILGTPYYLSFSSENDTRMGTSIGFMDHTTKEIVLKPAKKEDYTVGNIVEYYEKTLRHEIIHAFLYESGVFVNSCLFEEGWAMNEEMVDFFALQHFKINSAINKGEILLHRLLEGISDKYETEKTIQLCTKV